MWTTGWDVWKGIPGVLHLHRQKGDLETKSSAESLLEALCIHSPLWSCGIGGRVSSQCCWDCDLTRLGTICHLGIILGTRIWVGSTLPPGAILVPAMVPGTALETGLVATAVLLPTVAPAATLTLAIG